MQNLIEYYHKELDKLNFFEKQKIKALLNRSNSNGMSRFYMAFISSPKQTFPEKGEGVEQKNTSI